MLLEFYSCLTTFFRYIPIHAFYGIFHCVPYSTGLEIVRLEFIFRLFFWMGIEISSSEEAKKRKIGAIALLPQQALFSLVSHIRNATQSKARVESPLTPSTI